MPRAIYGAFPAPHLRYADGFRSRYGWASFSPMCGEPLPIGSGRGVRGISFRLCSRFVGIPLDAKSLLS
jgi:hypothetical protein